MSNYCYEAVDAGGLKTQGTLEVADQNEAVRRIKEMGLFPTRIIQERRRRLAAGVRPAPVARRRNFSFTIPLFDERVKPRALTVFTRQLATLVDAGMPLLRGLRILHEQAESPALKHRIEAIALSIENGNSLSEALKEHPKVFNPLYVNMVRAGEMSGALEITLRRLAEFAEKAQKIKGKVKGALFYPVAVLVVAVAIIGVLTVFVIPRFKLVFDGLLQGKPLPSFTRFIFDISGFIQNHFVLTSCLGAALAIGCAAGIRTEWGRVVFDRFKLMMPLLGPVYRKAAISRFTRTFGTLLGNGVPVLQALAIVKETTGNVVVSRIIANVHDSVKQGETIAAPLKASNVFPAMVAGMVEIGEQTGALPDMLMKIADGYEDEVDTAVGAMTSLMEPIMIVFLAVVVGSIVIAMFLPILAFIDTDPMAGSSGSPES